MPIASASSTYLPVAVGAILGAVGSLALVLGSSAIVIGEAAFVALTGAIALIAGVGLIYVWSWRGDGS